MLDRVAEGAYAGKNDLVGPPDVLRVGDDAAIGADLLERLLHASQISHSVVDDRDHNRTVNTPKKKRRCSAPKPRHRRISLPVSSRGANPRARRSARQGTRACAAASGPLYFAGRGHGGAMRRHHEDLDAAIHRAFGGGAVRRDGTVLTPTARSQLFRRNPALRKIPHDAQRPLAAQLVIVLPPAAFDRLVVGVAEDVDVVVGMLALDGRGDLVERGLALGPRTLLPESKRTFPSRAIIMRRDALPAGRGRASAGAPPCVSCVLRSCSP